MSRVLDAMRNPEWLKPDRARLYFLVITLPVVAVFGGMVWRIFGLNHPEGQPGSTDFLAFWAAGHLAFEGRPALAYDGAALAAMQQVVVGPLPGGGVLGFFHPPPVLLLFMPFGALSYPLAATLWLGLTGVAAMMLTARLLSPPLGFGLGLMVALAFPPYAVNMQFAQMGFLVLALYGCAAPHSRSVPGSRAFASGFCR